MCSIGVLLSWAATGAVLLWSKVIWDARYDLIFYSESLLIDTFYFAFEFLATSIKSVEACKPFAEILSETFIDLNDTFSFTGVAKVVYIFKDAVDCFTYDFSLIAASSNYFIGNTIADFFLLTFGEEALLIVAFPTVVVGAETIFSILSDLEL